MENTFWEKLAETTVIGSKREANRHLGVALEVSALAKGKGVGSQVGVWNAIGVCSAVGAETRVGNV